MRGPSEASDKLDPHKMQEIRLERPTFVGQGGGRNRKSAKPPQSGDIDIDFPRIKCMKAMHPRLQSSTFVGQGGGRNRNMPKRPQSGDIDIDFARIKCIEIGREEAECVRRPRL